MEMRMSVSPSVVVFSIVLCTAVSSALNNICSHSRAKTTRALRTEVRKLRREIVSQYSRNKGYSYASCQVKPNPARSNSMNITGYVYLREKPLGLIRFKPILSGFTKRGLYGIHVHEAADFENGCDSFGGHYNPYDGRKHGAPFRAIESRHVGDWGNIPRDESDYPYHDFFNHSDNLASLFGPHSIVGRGIVIHAGKDDLGSKSNEESLRTGNAGARIACCVIGWSKGGPW